MAYSFKKVEKYVKREGINNKSRMQHLVDQRSYLAKYLRYNGETFHTIGKLFNLHHSTIIHSIKKYDDIHTSMDFILNCRDLIIEFPVTGDMEVFRDKLSKNNKVLINLNGDEYLALQSYRIDNMIYTNEGAIKHMINSIKDNF